METWSWCILRDLWTVKSRWLFALGVLGRQPTWPKNIFILRSSTWFLVVFSKTYAFLLVCTSLCCRIFLTNKIKNLKDTLPQESMVQNSLLLNKKFIKHEIFTLGNLQKKSYSIWVSIKCRVFMLILSFCRKQQQQNVIKQCMGLSKLSCKMLQHIFCCLAN